MKWAEFNVGNPTFVVNNSSFFDPDAKPQIGGSAVAFAVEDLEATIDQLQAKSVTVTIPTQETPVCHFACVADPDGNSIWFHHRKDGTFGD